jgi:hypothetical protein
MHWSRAGSSTIRHRWVDTKFACCQVLVGCMTLQSPFSPVFRIHSSAPGRSEYRVLLKSDDSDVLPCWHRRWCCHCRRVFAWCFLTPPEPQAGDRHTHDEYRGCQARP